MCRPRGRGAVAGQHGGAPRAQSRTTTQVDRRLIAPRLVKPNFMGTAGRSSTCRPAVMSAGLKLQSVPAPSPTPLRPLRSPEGGGNAVAAQEAGRQRAGPHLRS